MENEIVLWLGKSGRILCLAREKIRKDSKSRELENQWLWQSSENAPLLLKGKGCSF